MSPGKLRRNEKFEDGVLRTDACIESHSRPRKYQYRTYREDLSEQAFGLSAVWEEKRLMNDVYKLIDKGFKPNGSESLESFVEKHREHIDEGVV